MPYFLQSNVHYYVGDSSDTKPVDDITIGSICHETDTAIDYRWDGTNWTAMEHTTKDFQQRVTDDRSADLLGEIIVELKGILVHMREITGDFTMENTR